MSTIATTKLEERHPQAEISGSKGRAHFDQVQTILAKSGLTRTSIENLLAIDAEVFQWRRRLQKHQFAREALLALKLDLEHAQFEALIVIAQISFGYGGAPPRPATVGAIAEELVLDPSRASRLASDLVSKGYARRSAIQEDGRKSSLKLTKAGEITLEAVAEHKWRRMAEIYGDWPEAELAQFAALLHKLNHHHACTAPFKADAKTTARAASIAQALSEEGVAK